MCDNRRLRGCDARLSCYKTNRSLQLVHRFTALEQRVVLAPGVRDGQVVAQEQGSQQASEMFRSAMNGSPTAADPRRWMACAAEALSGPALERLAREIEREPNAR